MTAQTNQTSNLYALLIGIDFYLPNRLPDGSSYKNLGGCVRDINHVEAFLKQMRKVPDAQILKLTASQNPAEATKPLEPPEKLPTRQNIVDYFRKLGAIAPPGSQVYIHYSGHGGRAKTIFPDIKDPDGIDEGLVPADIGTSEGQYLRDLELAQLLQDLVNQQLTVTLVLDCCHSGGATRGDAEIRGMNVVDDKPLQAGQELVAPLKTLATTWQSLTAGETRGLKAGGLPQSEDYVVLAACRPNEFAFEYAFNRETKERNGALTYWLLDTLRQQNPGQTYKDLYDRINAKIHSQFPQQTPMLMGTGNRELFGSDSATTVYAVPVLKVQTLPTGETQAELGIGQANGVGKGAEFAIYPRGTTNLSAQENRIAIARIIQRGATESQCRLEPIEGKELKVEQGDQAVLISASVNLVRKISLSLEAQATVQQDALEQIKQALAGNGWIELAEDVATTDDDEGVAYQVVVNKNAEYEICDRTGYPYENMKPVIKVGDPNAAKTIVNRLVHLAKYHATAELDNTDKDSPLAGKLAVEWLGTSDTYELGDKIPPKSQLKMFAVPSQPKVTTGEYIFLLIRNNYSQPLNIAVLNLASDWEIEQIHPRGQGEYFTTLDPGKTEVIPLEPSLEGDGAAVENTVKVFATVGAANFRWLELPSLDEQLQSKGFSIHLGNPLEALLAAIDDEQPQTRKLTVAASASSEWTTKQVTLKIAK
ncbi:caspase family protein [Calothrix sp. FACHB-1219]|uniref:caspase family protein n=1 Tax=unclassified Calothrix TaxID=2619626 RepID=UPI0016897CE9|nr:MULTISPECIES: caspase family protein [unclassified Calothrix]MBD2206242.1 caspase family protein [Calothrix sp. FACHB-168]MBD2219138.1 caspase family protein [Calothrix sp. FACHB-1219]